LTVTVRPPRRADVEQVVEVGLRAWREGFKEVVPPDLVPDREEMARRIEHYAAKPGRPVTVAVGELGGELCGYAAFGASRDHDAAPDVGEIYALYVDPSAWRRGVGRALVEHGLDRLAESGFAEAMLWTFAETARSRRFYESLGFTHDGGTQRRHMSGGALEVRYRIGLRAARQ
jgi:ribosomal protein S18 acetylase RimI-like enzyme